MDLDPAIIDRLRDLARQRHSVASMFSELKKLLKDPYILDILFYFRAAFNLSLAEAKPLAALSRNEAREIADARLLEELVQPEIEKHRPEWDC